MAVRLINLHAHPLRVDLRGGGVLVLASGQRSAALREELLYDNCHLPTWERAGWIARVPARMREVLADAEPQPAAPPEEAPRTTRRKATARRTAAPPAAPPTTERATERAAKPVRKAKTRAAPARRKR
jgi:hypothetical protein